MNPHPAPAATNPRGTRSFYRPELDAVRFLAFLAVFLHHTLPRYAAAYNLPAPLPNLAAAAVNAGGFGLSLFFTLSAYLICELLLREKSITHHLDLTRFYKRRILRIWPLYFLGLAIGAIYAFHYGNLRKELPWFAAYTFMSGNIVTSLFGWGSISGGPIGPLWSISIEEQFYLLWPSLVKHLTPARLRLAAWSLLGFANLTLVYFGLRHADLDSTVWTNSFAELYLFAAGVLLSIHLHGRMPTLSILARFGLAAATPILWITASLTCHLKDRGALATVPTLLLGYLMVAAGCLTLMLALMGIACVPAWAAYLGRLSYGLYVFHRLAIIECDNAARHFHLRHPTAVTELPAFLITVALAALSYRYFEAPFRRWKDRQAIIHSQPPEALTG